MEWTYCSDHQPKKDGRYIVTIKFDDRLTIVGDLFFHMDIYDEFDTDRNEHRPGWLSWSDEYGFSLYYDESKVIAWMPYPKPAEDR